MQFGNPTFDDLNDKAAKELDPAKRSGMYIEMQRVWDEDANVIWIAWPSYTWAARKDVVPVLRPDGQPVAQAFHPA
jgi:ABC-type transport system substrate-binding protein